ncbi:MAG: hypothetical protein WDW38_007454 [Sanguina aurantia]
MPCRRASKVLGAVSDSSRTSITLHPGHLQDAVPYLNKLTAVTAVTIRAPLNCNDPHWCDLTLVSSLFPHLTSLTFESCCLVNNGYALSPWKQCLTHLKLQNCTMWNNVVLISPHPYLHSWSPDLPFLESLVIKAAVPTSLNLAGCPLLSTLELNSCGALRYVIGSRAAMTACHAGWELLQSAQDSRSKAQLPPAFNMSGCDALVSLKLRACGEMSSLDVGGCSALRFLDFSYNPDLSGVKFPGCESLGQITCTGSTSLCLLDTSSCSKLEVLICADNQSLQLILQGSSSSLRALHCVNNARIAALHLSRFQHLERIELYGNKGLTPLSATGLRALRSQSQSVPSSLASLGRRGGREMLETRHSHMSQR